MYICKSEVSAFGTEPFLIFVDVFTPFGSFVSCSHALSCGSMQSLMLQKGLTAVSVAQNQSSVFCLITSEGSSPTLKSLKISALSYTPPASQVSAITACLSTACKSFTQIQCDGA